MEVLLVHTNRLRWGSLDRTFNNVNKYYPTVWLASTLRQACNYLVDTKDIGMVFMGLYLDDGRDVISTGLLQDFIQHGYGVGQKPLIAASPKYNWELVKAGCSHETDLTFPDLERLVRTIEMEKEFQDQMLRAV